MPTGVQRDLLRRVRLDAQLADRILASVREHLPPQVTIKRKRRKGLRIRSSWERFSHHYGGVSAFAHVRRSDSPSKATERCLTMVLDEVTRHLRNDDQRWPELDYGPVQIETRTSGDVVHADITDRHGTKITFPPVATRTGNS